MSHKSVITAALLLSLALGVVLAEEAPRVSEQNSSVPIRLEGWQYRWGDSPLDEAGTPVWLHEDESSPGWRDIVSITTPPGADDQNFAWYRIRLPQNSWSNPTLYFPVVAVAFEVYLDTTRIYQFGKMESAQSNKYTVVTNHLAPLPGGFQQKMLMIRVYSPDAGIIGMGDYGESVWIGSEHDLVRIMFRISAESMLLGFLFMFVGLLSGFFSIRWFRGKTFFSLSFGVFAFFIGLFHVLQSSLACYLIESPGVKFYLRFGAYLLFPVGLYIFLQQITGARRLIKSLWLLHLAIAFIVLSLDALRLVPLVSSAIPYNLFLLGTLVIALYLALNAAFGGNRNARIFVLGFAVACSTGLHDILVGLGHLPHWRWISHWGTLVFVLCLVYILSRLFAVGYRRLHMYSRELERKSEELREYSRTLERRVSERTQDLATKNKELGHALDQLREAQQQLVLQEKMASLGDLVAGVAHEMNNPIGAINSATDVSSRCLDRLEETVEQSGSVQDVLENRHYQTAMRLLKENTRIALEGSGRVTRIIRSLKNFARLDEAEVQEADIHEGIESTLTLVHHQLKNSVEVVKEFGDIPKIMCYPNQLNQVFMNLFVNAAQAMEDKGTLRIVTKADDKNVVISVADTGKGIPPENLGKIFDPGFTTKGRGVGTGLGLSISYNIIQKHGGSLSVESEVGRGTEFTISLPISK